VSAVGASRFLEAYVVTMVYVTLKQTYPLEEMMRVSQCVGLVDRAMVTAGTLVSFLITHKKCT
jgi:hypothetical protein